MVILPLGQNLPATPDTGRNGVKDGKPSLPKEGKVSKDEDIVRVLRVIEYVGPRSALERHMTLIKNGEYCFGNVVMRSSVIGTDPEVLPAEDWGDYTQEDYEAMEDYETIYGWGGQG